MSSCTPDACAGRDGRRDARFFIAAAAALLIVGVTGDTSLNEGKTLHNANYVSFATCLRDGTQSHVAWNVASATLCLIATLAALCGGTTLACRGCACATLGCGPCGTCDTRTAVSTALGFAWPFGLIALALYSIDLVIFGSAARQCALCRGFVPGSPYTGSKSVDHCLAGDVNNANAFRFDAGQLWYSAPIGINIAATCLATLALLCLSLAVAQAAEAAAARVQAQAGREQPYASAWQPPPQMMPFVMGVPQAAPLSVAVVGQPAGWAASPSVTVGSRAVIRGLTLDTQLNGEAAEVRGLDAETGLVEVTVLSNGEHYRVPRTALYGPPLEVF